MKIFRVWFEQGGEYEYLEFKHIEEATKFYSRKINEGTEAAELETFESLLSYSVH